MIVSTKTLRLSTAFKLTVAAASLVATVAQFLLAKNVADALNLFSYFTIQSNLIVTAVLVIAVFRPSPRPDAMLRAATFWILITVSSWAAWS
jgi:hypothetical protein